MKKYFPQRKVLELIYFLKNIAIVVNPPSINFSCRDEKDNFLLDIIESAKVDILVTGDKDLIALNPFKSAQILTPGQFEMYMYKEF